AVHQRPIQVEQEGRLPRRQTRARDGPRLAQTHTEALALAWSPLAPSWIEPSAPPPPRVTGGISPPPVLRSDMPARGPLPSRPATPAFPRPRVATVRDEGDRQRPGEQQPVVSETPCCDGANPSPRGAGGGCPQGG